MGFHNWKINELCRGIKYFAAVEEVFIIFQEGVRSPARKNIEKKVSWAMKQRLRLVQPEWCEIHGPQCICTPRGLPELKRTTLSKLKSDLGADEVLIDERKVSCPLSQQGKIMES
jgi:hypothetical protein